jgi:molybdate transport system permease protein
MDSARLRERSARKARIRDGALAASAYVLAGLFILFTGLSIAGLVSRASPAAVLQELSRPVVLQALLLSLKTTLAAAAIIVVFGTPLAAVLTRPFLGRSVVETLVTLPVVLPPVVAGMALLLAFGRAGLIGHALRAAGIDIAFSSVAVVLAQTLVAAPLYIMAAKSAFERVDRDLVDAAATLHATPAYAFLRIVAPPALPALAAGLALSWARALGEFGATITFAGNLPGVSQTMPLAVYIQGQEDLDAAIAIAAVLLVVSFVVLLAMRRLSRPQPSTT